MVYHVTLFIHCSRSGGICFLSINVMIKHTDFRGYRGITVTGKRVSEGVRKVASSRTNHGNNSRYAYNEVTLNGRNSL